MLDTLRLGPILNYPSQFEVGLYSICANSVAPKQYTSLAKWHLDGYSFKFLSLNLSSTFLEVHDVPLATITSSK